MNVLEMNDTCTTRRGDAPVNARSASVTPPSGHEPAVVLADVTKRFPVRQTARAALTSLRAWPPRWPREHRTALSSVSLVARRGECLGLLGPNGAGKTTLFRMIAGVVLPDAGSVEIHGHAREGAARDAVIAFASVDERSLYWRLSAAENVRLYVTLYGARGDDARRRIADSLERVGLAETGAQPVGSFSSGMRQRLLVARALAIRPDVLLLDEPTRSLDPVSARELRRFLREDVVGRDGCTVLLATHSGEEAMELCDRVAVLDRGRLLAIDPARSLAERFGDARLRVWTTQPTHVAFAELEQTGMARRESASASTSAPPPDGPDGWSAVTLQVDGGDVSGAAVVSRLAAAGVPLARVERVSMSLADLVERITMRVGT